MQERNVGRTGLRVSHLGLGTMTWGRDTDKHEATEQLVDFFDAGGNLIDTAGSYAGGSSEELIGELLAQTVDRDDLVLVSKSGVRHIRDGATQIDASRSHMLNSLDASLARLGTDHLDVWLVQNPDSATPLEETISALEIAVSSGRTRYVGISNFPGWTCAAVASRLQNSFGLTVAEMEYSLLQRGIEREVLPAAKAMGFGLFAWSPLGRGVLTGKYRHTTPPDSRAASAHLGGFVLPYLGEQQAAVLESVIKASEGLGRTALEVSLAWVRDSPGISSAIVGARTAAQLRAILKADDFTLPDPIRTALNDVTSLNLSYPERFREQARD